MPAPIKEVDAKVRRPPESAIADPPPDRETRRFADVMMAASLAADRRARRNVD